MNPLTAEPFKARRPSLVPSPLPGEPCFLIDGLCISYGTKAVLRDFGMPIARGGITALIGPSGCGKTSLLSSLNRLTDLIPSCRVTGRILFEGIEICGGAVDLAALRRRVGMIFQRPAPFPLSIRNNITLPLRDHGVRRAEAERTAVEVLRSVGLWEEVCDRLDTPATALSGGQQQRLCIARALALTPEVILLDEPCSSLDPLSSKVVEDLILSFRGRYTVVVVTHNLAQARRIADHVAFLWVEDGCGRLIEHGPAAQLFNSPRQELTASYVCGARG